MIPRITFITKAKQYDTNINSIIPQVILNSAPSICQISCPLTPQPFSFLRPRQGETTCIPCHPWKSALIVMICVRVPKTWGKSETKVPANGIKTIAFSSITTTRIPLYQMRGSYYSTVLTFSIIVVYL